MTNTLKTKGKSVAKEAYEQRAAREYEEWLREHPKTRKRARVAKFDEIADAIKGL